MKTRIILVLSLVVLQMAVTVAQTVTSFIGTVQGSDIRLEWRLDNEFDVQSFELARKKADEPTFSRIATVNPNGSSSYQYLDTELYKNQDPQNLVSYRLMVRTAQGTQTYFTSINHAPTAVQRSWGSIKSMFR